MGSATLHPGFVLNDLGTGVGYADARAHMQLAASHARRGHPALLLCEHRPTITFTRSGGQSSFLSTTDEIRAAGIDVVQADRGGDVTFHGPGQLVGYPIVDLTKSAPGVRTLAVDYVRALERGLILALEQLGITGAHARPGLTGVWIPDARGATPLQKIVSIGVGVSPKGITRHGFALNVDIDIERYAQHIVPCGLIGHEMTNLRQQLGQTPSSAHVRSIVASAVTFSLAEALGLPAGQPLESTTQRMLLGATNG